MVHPARNVDGFSLLELSIVLVIAGLLTGGVVVGSSLIRASEVRSVLNDKTAFSTAMNTFRIKFNNLPGDFADATRYWGVAAGSGDDAACYGTDQSSGTLTCNGNGNGILGRPVWWGSQDDWERVLAWKHLANAKLVNGSFSGVLGNGETPGVNAPASRVGNATYSIMTVPNDGPANWGDWYGNGSDYGVTLIFGAPNPPFENQAPTLSPSEVQSLDTKGDDGKPGKGQIRTYNTQRLTNCATSDDANVAVYNTGFDGIACSVMFLQVQ